MQLHEAVEYYAGRTRYHRRMAGRWLLVVVALGLFAAWMLISAGIDIAELSQ